jgi:hypothetical protein
MSVRLSLRAVEALLLTDAVPPVVRRMPAAL